MSDNPTGQSPFSEPIARRNTYELVAESLLALIGERRLRPGDAVPTERELTGVYRVGRSSIREALRVLESKGVIEQGPRGGFVVADSVTPLNRSLQLLLTLEEASLRELFEVRRMLELEVAALAATHRNRRHLARLARAIEEMVDGLSDEDRYITADVRFHLVLAEASGNRLVQHVMLAIRELLRRALATIYHIPASAEQSIEQHREILRAVEAKDAAAARAAMRDHLGAVEAAIQDALAPARKRRRRTAGARRG